jgi:hypothetical protein
MNSQDAVSRAVNALISRFYSKTDVGLADVFRAILERESQILGNHR